MSKKIFSGIDSLPKGTASKKLTKGCIVLEGGAFRSVYEGGVLDALMEADINMQCTIGVSAGAMNGMNYVSGQIGRSARISLKYRHDSRYVGMKAFQKNKGIIGFDFAFNSIPNDPFDIESFNSPEKRFIAVVTNCVSGETEYFEKGKCSDIFSAVRASASMPYVSKMVEIENKRYLDGGCSVKVPYKWAIQENFDKIIIIRTRPSEWRYETKNKNSLPHLIYRSYPKLAEKLESSPRRYNELCDEMTELENLGRVFMICPSRLIPVERLEKNMEKLGELYYLGYNDGKAAVGKLKEYLEK